MTTTPSKTMAAFWMAGWLCLMLIMAVAGRETTRELNVFQIMEVRSLAGFLLLSPIIYRAGGFRVLRTSRLPQHIGRNLVHYVAQLGWFFALTLIPIGQVVAIEFTMPIWTAILAASFLSERMTPWKIAAIALGLVGVIVIVRPATGEINPELAVRPCLGLGRRDRRLRHVLTLLSRQRDAVCGCDHRRSHGFPAGSADGDGRLAAVFGAARRLDRAGCSTDPVRQSAEFETSRAGCRPRPVNRAPLRATKRSGRA